MKKHSNKSHNKIFKKKRKERLRRKHNKQKQSNVVTFDEFELNKVTFVPCEKNDVTTMKILYNDKPLSIKTPTIAINKSYPILKSTSDNLSIKLNFDESNKEHKTFLDMLTEIDECFSHNKFYAFPRYQYKKDKSMTPIKINAEQIKIISATIDNECQKRKNDMYFWLNM